MTLTGNAATILAARVVTAVANLGLAVLIASRIGSGGFGTFAALVGGGAVANLLVTFGFDLVVVRAVADRRADARATVQRAAALQLLGAGAGVALAGTLVVAGVASSLVLLPAISLVPLGVTTVASAVIRGVQEMKDLLVAATLSSAAALGFAVIVVDGGGPASSGFGNGVAAAVVAVLVGQVVNAALLASRARVHLLSHRIEPDGPSPAVESDHNGGNGPRSLVAGLPTLLSESWVFATATVASAVMAQGAVIIFEIMSNGDSGGLAAGLRLAETARMVPAAAFAALFPAMFDGVHRSLAYRRLFSALVAYAVVAVAGLLVLAPWLARWFFDDPPDGTTVIRIIALGLLATAFRLRFSFELIAEGRERAVMVATVATTVLAVTGYLVGSVMDRVVVVAATQVMAIAVNAAWLGLVLPRSVEAAAAPGSSTRPGPSP